LVILPALDLGLVEEDRRAVAAHELLRPLLVLLELLPAEHRAGRRAAATPDENEQEDSRTHSMSEQSTSEQSTQDISSAGSRIVFLGGHQGPAHLEDVLWSRSPCDPNDSRSQDGTRAPNGNATLTPPVMLRGVRTRAMEFAMNVLR